LLIRGGLKESGGNLLDRDKKKGAQQKKANRTHFMKRARQLKKGGYRPNKREDQKGEGSGFA